MSGDVMEFVEMVHHSMAMFEELTIDLPNLLIIGGINIYHLVEVSL
jgi:hypothetical protein